MPLHPPCDSAEKPRAQSRLVGRGSLRAQDVRVNRPCKRAVFGSGVRGGERDRRAEILSVACLLLTPERGECGCEIRPPAAPGRDNLWGRSAAHKKCGSKAGHAARGRYGAAIAPAV